MTPKQRSKALKSQLLLGICIALFVAAGANGEQKTKTENFDRDPGGE